MSLPTTLTALITELEGKTGVIEVLTNEDANKSPYSVPVVTVRFLYKPGDVADDISFNVFKNADDSIIYYKRIPDILLDEPEQREFYLTEQQIIDRIESADATKDVINISSLRHRDDMDQASVEYVKDNKIESDTYLIRKDDAPQWTQPAGKDDAPGVGDVVTHNGLLWRSLVKENETEPVEGANWTEITEDELIHINPRSKV